MKKLWTLYLRLPWDKRVLWSSAVIALIPIALTFLRATSPPEATAREVMQVDTFIPKGFVLVPIEVLNYEALDSILGPFGFVDLYHTPPTQEGQQKLVARNVKILRAPQNPSHFAVLIQESATASVLRFGGAFTAIVKRPGKDGTEFVNEVQQVRRSITYDGG